MRRKRIRVSHGPQGKAFTVIWTVLALLFVVLGVTTVLPWAGLFGVVWTAAAAGFAFLGIRALVTGQGMGREIIVEEDEAAQGGPDAPAEEAEARLRRLEDLYQRRVITREEYEARRGEIIGTL